MFALQIQKLYEIESKVPKNSIKNNLFVFHSAKEKTIYPKRYIYFQLHVLKVISPKL